MSINIKGALVGAVSLGSSGCSLYALGPVAGTVGTVVGTVSGAILGFIVGPICMDCVENSTNIRKIIENVETGSKNIPQITDPRTNGLANFNEATDKGQKAVGNTGNILLQAESENFKQKQA